MADNTMIIVAVIAVLICICSSVSGVAFYMNQATPEETPETAGSPPPPAGSPPPPAASGVTCKADGTWSNNSPVPPGTVITKSCPTGGSQTAKCKADGSWESDWQCSGASPAASGVTCKADGTWSNNSPVPPGTVITKACPSGGNQTATCKADGNWDSDWQCSGAPPFTSFKHKSGKCVHPSGGSSDPGNGTPAVFWDGCDADNLKYRFTPGGSIRHKTSNKCLHPSGGSSNPGNGTILVFWDGCDADNLKFQRLSNGAMKHIGSGRCIHPRGGSSTPGNGTELVLNDGCDEDRLTFTFV